MAIMELYDFNRCNERQKTALVWAYGEFITVRIDGDCSVCLYHMEKFFAEVWYRVADNTTELVRGFKSNACLEPYLNLVDIRDINWQIKNWSK